MYDMDDYRKEKMCFGKSRTKWEIEALVYMIEKIS